MKTTVKNTYIVDGICKLKNRIELGFPSWSGILKWSEDLFVKHIIVTQKTERYDYEKEIIEIENIFRLIFNDEDYEKAILLLSSKNRWIQSDNEI